MCYIYYTQAHVYSFYETSFFTFKFGTEARVFVSQQTSIEQKKKQRYQLKHFQLVHQPNHYSSNKNNGTGSILIVKKREIIDGPIWIAGGFSPLYFVDSVCYGDVLMNRAVFYRWDWKGWMFFSTNFNTVRQKRAANTLRDSCSVQSDQHSYREQKMCDTPATSMNKILEKKYFKFMTKLEIFYVSPIDVRECVHVCRNWWLKGQIENCMRKRLI